MKCVTCAAELDDDDNFCRKCGKAVERISAPCPCEIVKDKPPKRRRRRGELKFFIKMRGSDREFTEEEWHAGGEEVRKTIVESIMYDYWEQLRNIAPVSPTEPHELENTPDKGAS
ncbi:MAG: zinc-ribbon domain-containing protein [Armatimonadota bacterium]